jgi:hypothetical protein
VTDEQETPPPKADEDESSAFKRLLTKIARVPKEEVDEREREYQRAREPYRRKAR